MTVDLDVLRDQLTLRVGTDAVGPVQPEPGPEPRTRDARLKILERTLERVSLDLEELSGHVRDREELQLASLRERLEALEESIASAQDLQRAEDELAMVVASIADLKDRMNEAESSVGDADDPGDTGAPGDDDPVRPSVEARMQSLEDQMSALESALIAEPTALRPQKVRWHRRRHGHRSRALRTAA